METYFLQGPVIRKDCCYNNTILHDALQQQGEGEETEIRHNTLVTEPMKNQEIQELHSCHLLNRNFSHRTCCLWPIRKSLKPGHSVTDDLTSLFKNISYSMCLWSSNWIYCPQHQHLFFWKNLRLFLVEESQLSKPEIEEKPCLPCVR